MPVRFVAFAAATSVLFFSFGAQADEHEQSSAHASARTYHVGALVGAGAPSLASAEVVLQYRSYLVLAADFGTTPTIHVPIGPGIGFGGRSMSVSARMRPFKGDLFVGIAVGSQRFEASTTNPLDGSAVYATTSSLYVMPQVGFLHRFGSGFALGADLGVELPLMAHVGESIVLPQSAHNAMQALATSPIPVLNVLRLGYVL